jgi:hypothetical protein
MPELPTKITRKEAKDAVLRSGYLLESRVEATLRELIYNVQASAPFSDPKTGVSREMDIYALGAFPVFPGRQLLRKEWLFAGLLIECVNNSQPLAFIVKEPQMDTGFLHAEHVKVAGVPTLFAGRGPEGRISLHDFIKLEEYHHYCRGTIATQWCSFSPKKANGQSRVEWLASHDEERFNDLRKLSVASDYYAARPDESKSAFVIKGEINLTFFYPILVVQGELLEVRPTKRSLNLVGTDHVRFCRSLATTAEERDYQIDVVTERFFPKLCDMIGQEMEITARRLKRREKDVREAIKLCRPTAAVGLDRGTE